jgi:TM2 domain-containing membrane protein YozV
LRAQIGVHRFYLGKIGTGFHVIVTGAGLGIWVLVHFIVILVSSFKDKEDRLLINWS